MGGSSGEFQEITNKLVNIATAYGMEVNTEKSKIMTNSKNNISADINMSSQKLKEVANFKYLGATLCKDGTIEVRIRVALAMAAMAKQDRAVQHHQLQKQVQAQQVSCRLHPPVWQ